MSRPEPFPDEWLAERDRMVEQIRRHFLDTGYSTGEPDLTAPVRAALERVPRHEFVPKTAQHRAYADSALPIGSGQTISQPFIVALMTQLSRVEPISRVLEVGTGCGYQAAVLAEIATRVHTIERVPELAERAAATLARLGYDGVEVRSGDGYEGWPEQAPFDVILVTAGAREIPSPLVEQIATNGRMVLPVSAKRGLQDLVVVTKDGNGAVETRPVLPVAFVPLIHETKAS